MLRGAAGRSGHTSSHCDSPRPVRPETDMIAARGQSRRTAELASGGARSDRLSTSGRHSSSSSAASDRNHVVALRDPRAQTRMTFVLTEEGDPRRAHFFFHAERRRTEGARTGHVRPQSFEHRPQLVVRLGELHHPFRSRAVEDQLDLAAGRGWCDAGVAARGADCGAP
jgi:hypothetical protein